MLYVTGVSILTLRFDSAYGNTIFDNNRPTAVSSCSYPCDGKAPPDTKILDFF
jgi:hypothetical protein